jgi:hypothetical protein
MITPFGGGKAMRMVLRVALVCLLVSAILIPATALSNQLPDRMEKTLYPGRNDVSYAGQNFVFNTTVIINITFIPLDLNKIELRVKVRPTRSEPGSGQTQSEETLSIDWLNWNDQLYNGTPPTDPWGIILDTESGYTEK